MKHEQFLSHSVCAAGQNYDMLSFLPAIKNLLHGGWVVTGGSIGERIIIFVTKYLHLVLFQESVSFFLKRQKTLQFINVFNFMYPLLE
jgi:hypothetical protein